MASVLEVGCDGQRRFNIFSAAPENDAQRDQMQNGQDKVSDGSALPDYFL